MTETLERNKRTVTQFYDLMFKQWTGCRHARNPNTSESQPVSWPPPMSSRTSPRHGWRSGNRSRAMTTLSRMLSLNPACKSTPSSEPEAISADERIALEAERDVRN
jgi:hypothetical protein